MCKKRGETPGKHGKYKKTGETIGEKCGNIWGNGRNMRGTASRSISESLSHHFSS